MIFIDIYNTYSKIKTSMKKKSKNPTLTDWKTITYAFKNMRRNNPISNKYYMDLVSSKTMRKYYEVPVEIANSINTSKLPTADNNLIQFLDLMGVSNINLDENTGILNNEKNPRRLGRLIKQSGVSKYETMLKRRNNDVTSASDSYIIIVSAHPYDILTSSFNRSWTSCMNLDGGCYSGDLVKGLTNPEAFKLVAYLCHSSDRSIKKPLGRVFLNGYTHSSKVWEPYDRRYVEKSKTYTFYNNIRPACLDSFRTKKMPTRHIFDVSSSSYGRFPVRFKRFLCGITMSEVNNMKTPNLQAAYDVSTFYPDNNNLTIRKIQAPVNNLTKPLKPTKKTFTVDDVLLHGKKYDSKIYKKADYVPRYYYNGVKYRQTAAERVIELKTSKDAHKINFLLNRYPKLFYQIKLLTDKNSFLFKNKEVRDCISGFGPEYKYLMNTKYNNYIKAKEQRKNDKKIQ